MLLRASGQSSHEAVDLRAITDPEVAAKSGVAYAAELVAFADAVVGDDDTALSGARERVRQALGPEGLVDAAAVAANFQRMVRVADSTGIPLDTPVSAMTGDIRKDLDLASFGSARNSQEASPVQRLLGRLFRPLAPHLMRLMARR